MKTIAVTLIVLLIIGIGWPGCTGESGLELPARLSELGEADDFTLVARLVHITDSHIVDEQSPARFTMAHPLIDSAWRPQEAYSTQILDGIIRSVNRIHAAGRTIDFLVHTGDGCDNVQSNELTWFMAVMNGGTVDPLSGVDDRAENEKPPILLDPHHAFGAQGLYRNGLHGGLATIPWYAVPGNHDQYAIGIFPIIEYDDGSRMSPLPLGDRPAVVLPVVLDPVSPWAYGRVTPATPGPPRVFDLASYVEPNPARAYFRKNEYVGVLSDGIGIPVGHGMGAPASPPVYWYSTSPTPGLRLIGLDTTDPTNADPGAFYDQGALSRRQLHFLRQELDTALEQDELVIVASHHPPHSLSRLAGSEVGSEELHTLLGEYPNVVLHLAGHLHRNRVTDQGGYLELETCSTLDLPQEGRMIEIRRDANSGAISIAYEMFSHVSDDWPALGDDPLSELREQALALAHGDKGATARQRRLDPSGTDPHGKPSDRSGVVLLKR